MSREIVVGLETHVELSTKTKIFCSCTTKFGGEPNTQCCQICTGQPGSLPVLNKRAVELAVMAGLALNCRINNHSVMARKHYTYPDLPKAYQISQSDKPLCEDGSMQLSDDKAINIERIHIEEDAGKLIHTQGAMLIDCNRGGVPLIEIVTAPDFRSAEEAVLYLEKLQSILRAVNVSDCRMQEGSLRCDVNISLRPKGSDTLGTRVEIKNLNSFVSVAAAIEYEYERQMDILDSDGVVEQETRSFSADTGETVRLRGKENADDYRYFADPDIGDVYVSDDEIERLRKLLPELPDKKFERYVNELSLTSADAKLLTKYSKVSEYFEATCALVKEPKTVASIMIMQMFALITTEIERENWSPKTSPEQLGELIKLMESGKLSRNLAKRVLGQMLETGKNAEDFISADDLSGLSQEALGKFCKEIIVREQKTVADYLNGKEKAIKALVGAVMRETKGRANAIEAEELLKKFIMHNS